MKSAKMQHIAQVRGIRDVIIIRHSWCPREICNRYKRCKESRTALVNWISWKLHLDPSTSHLSNTTLDVYKTEGWKWPSISAVTLLIPQFISQSKLLTFYVIYEAHMSREEKILNLEALVSVFTVNIRVVLLNCRKLPSWRGTKFIIIVILRFCWRTSRWKTVLESWVVVVEPADS